MLRPALTAIWNRLTAGSKTSVIRDKPPRHLRRRPIELLGLTELA